MNLYNKDEDFNTDMEIYLKDNLLYENHVDDESGDQLTKISTYLGYKKYPYVSQLISLIILIETTQSLNMQENIEELQHLIKQ
eukprot:CAMPEP_0205810664 /NCGR_PEP_ID=MMETSP0205-20121125/14835_1 /ASSEMBLY_ACC=CAM_ASM_000278 /TAXON_ID=36767 /ORGANISM="Euplotes focardii, Strain TN1" /LENGTH=82 /DNA_ID=CAMNT_0053089003 /DNA_START=301 /DNA_END=546 /DNA_ORIENTATION=+